LKQPIPQTVKIFLIGIVIGIVLILFGWILAPEASFSSIFAGIIIFIIYGLNGWLNTSSIQKITPDLLRISITLGLLASTVFASEIILEYILIPKDNTLWEFLEYGIVFTLYFLSGLIGTYRTNKLWQGVIASVGSSVIATLLWAIFTLVVFYAFLGSPQQAQVFQSRWSYQTFALERDPNAFFMEEFMGLIFFNLIIGPLVALVLGLVGGMLGKTIYKKKMN
jgi:hypothetical protein